MSSGVARGIQVPELTLTQTPGRPEGVGLSASEGRVAGWGPAAWAVSSGDTAAADPD